MLNSLRDGQINYGTTNCPSAHVPPHNVVPSIHQNSHLSTEPSTPVYQWNANHRLEHLYGFHSRYYNLDLPTPYPPATNQYVPANVYGQNLPQCCQPCCRLRSQNIPKASPPQVLYNPRPVQQLNRSYKPKKTLKTPCSEQFLPYIPNDLPVKYDTQNCYQQKYNSSYLNNTNYCTSANNLWIPPASNSNWSNDRLRSIGRHSGQVSHDFNRENNYQRLPNYQSNPYSKPTSATHHIPYNYIPPLPDVHDYRPPVYHNLSKNNTTEYVSLDHNSRLPIASQNIQNPSSFQQYYNTQPVPYSDVQIPSESFKPPQITSKDTSKSNLNVREFLATWDEGEEESGEKSTEAAEPIVVLDCMTLDGDALTKIQEKLNVVSYENLEKVLKENQNPLVITTEPNEVNSLNNKPKLNLKSNFEPLDYTKRETGIIKPFVSEKKTSPETNPQAEKSYSVNFDGMVAWYGKKNTDISSTDLIERLADRIFNLSKSQENEGVSFGTAAYTGQITQTNRSIESSDKNISKYIQSPQMFDLQHNANKCIEPPIMNKINYNKKSFPKVQSFVINESNKASTIKSNNVNSSCIVENITKKCLNATNEETSPWNLDQGVHEQHLNTSLYDHSVIMKPLDFSSLTDEIKGNPFVFDKLALSDNKPNDIINNQCNNKAFNQNNSYNSIVPNNQHTIQQIDASNRNFPVIVSPHRQEYNGFHESVIQRTGCDKNKHDKISTQTDFESINWNLSNDLDKIMKNTNMVMESSCLYDRNNYILDSVNSDKNISTRWKDNVPCVDLTINNKPNSHNDSFFDGWSFIESFENHPGKKIMNFPPNANSLHQLFPNQTNPSEPPSKNNNLTENNITDNTSVVKDMPQFSKSNDILPSNRPSRDVFNLNNRIPDFSDGFELSVINEPQEYLQYKKDDNEHRADGSIFEHLNEPKCITTLNETLNYKNDQNKLDFVGLPSFKEKEPLAPVSAPSKLNVVKPTLRDPSQIYTVIKQKLKYDNASVDNNSAVTNKTENNSKEHHTNTFNVTDFKSKYNSAQLNQFDVWSEKFVLKGNSNSSSCAVVECDVEITQFKSTPENRNTLQKSNMSGNYQDKTMMLPENINRNLANNKIDIIENDKINSNDFINCLQSTKTDDQKYRDTFDEFETSFGFDIHCSNESNKSFHENIVNKCFDERINDQIGDCEINKVDSTNTSDANTKSSNNTQLPFQCDFQSSFLIKNYFDENKNKAVLDQNEISNHEKTDISIFKYHSENVAEFELQNNENIHSITNSVKNSGFNIDCHVGQIHNTNDNNNSNFINEVESFKPQHENTNKTRKISSTKKNNFDYLNIENRNFGFDNNKKSILESKISNETTILKNSIETNNISQIKHNDLNSNKLFNIPKNSNVDFELHVFELNSKSTSNVSQIEAYKKHELDRNKHSFDSKLNSDNAENIEHNINIKNIFELDNNNINMHNLEKMDDAFDFNTRIIQNLGGECSDNIKKATRSNAIFSNESQMKTNCGFEINDDENKSRLGTNCKNNVGIQENLKIDEISNLNCNDDAQRHDLIKRENINQEKDVDRIFEIGCIVNNVHDELNLENPKTQTDFDIQNKNTEKNLNNCNSRGNSNINNNLEVENIFKNIYDNLSNLNTKKNDTNILNNFCQNDMKIDDSKSLEVTEHLNLKNNNSNVVDKIFEESNIDVFHDASNEKFEETDNISLQELVSNSTNCLTTVSIQQNESMNEEKCKPALLEYSTNNSSMNENSIMSVEQNNKDSKESKIEQNNDTNIQPVEILKKNATQGDATLAILENLRSDILNTVKNTDKNNHTQNNSFDSSSFNSFELKSHQDSNEIYEVEDSINSGPCALSHVEITNYKNSSELIEIKDLISYGPNLSNHGVSISEQHLVETFEAVDLTSSRPNSLNNDKRPTEKLISENSMDPKLISINHDELTPQQNSNEIYNIENSMNSESSSINHDELKFQQYSDERVEFKDSNSSLRHNELKYDKHLNEINKSEDLTRSRPNLINQDELKYQNVNEINEVDGLNSSRSSSINKDKLKFRQNSNAIYESGDLNSSGSCPMNQDEFEFQQNANEIYESEDFIRFRPNVINRNELKYHKNFNEIEDLTCSMNHDELKLQPNSHRTNKAEGLTRSKPNSLSKSELKYHRNLNEINEVEYSISSKNSSINHDELELQQNSNAIYNSDDLNSSGSCSINQDELELQQNSNTMYESDDLNGSRSCSIYQDKLEFSQNSKDTDKVEDLTRSRSSSINQGKLQYHRNLNEMNDIEYSTSSGPSSVNQDELELQQNSNTMYESDDFNSSPTCSIYQDKLEFSQNSKDTDKVEDLTRSRSSSINQGKLQYHRNLNEMNDIEYSTSSGPSSVNQDELELQQNSNTMYESDDFNSSPTCSINQDKLEFQPNTKETDKAEDLTTHGHSSLNQDKLEFQPNSNETDNAKHSTTFVPSLTNQGKLELKNNLNEINEAVDLTVSRPNSLNYIEFESHLNLNMGIEDEDLIDSVGSNELICQKILVEPHSIKDSAVSEYNIHETKHDSCTKETDFKSVSDGIQLPRVKFILKCQSRNLVKRNIFDEEPTVPYKKLKVVKDEKIMTQHIFKKRNACFKQYKPLPKIYTKESVFEMNDRNLIKSTETMAVLPTTSNPVNSVQEVLSLSEGNKNHYKFVSFLDDQTYRKQDIEALNISVGVEGDAMDGGDYNGTLQTPIPSPFSDFQSEDHSPEQCGGEVYWDKSLEDEYKSVLHKTISKLVKVRVNVRDKFNSRLLARRVNEAKRRRRQKLLVADKEAVVIVGRIDDTIKPVIAAVKVSTNPMYKIKVQLPWRRIFNMNAVRNKTKDTKIELGPAKVEVRLSRTPGEWQVAACRSMTSPKSMLVVRRLVLQRAASPATNDCIIDDHHHNQRHDGGHGTNDNLPYELSRKLPKIVIRRNGQDNNYTSYVSGSGFESSGRDKDVGGEKNDDGGDDKNNGGNCVPQLMVRLVRDRKLDAMAVEGVTTLHLKHLVPISESEGEAAMELDMHCAKSVQYS